MKLHIGNRGIISGYGYGYSTRDKLYFETIELHDHFKTMQNSILSYNNKTYGGETLEGLFSTKCRDDNWLRNSRHVLGIDLDGDLPYEQASKYLDQCNIGYSVMESTPSHYWLFADYINTIENCIEFIYNIPGVDVKWLALCAEYKHLMFRAFPKTQGYPTFIGEPLPLSGLPGQWFYQVRAYFTSYEYLQLHDKLFGSTQAKKCAKCGYNKVSKYCSRCGSNNHEEIKTSESVFHPVHHI